MAQKNHIAYPQAKGAPAGFILPQVLMAKQSLERAYYTVATDDQTLHALNAETALLRISAVTKGLFVAFAENHEGVGQFDDYIPAGSMHEYGIDESITVVGLLADGGAAGAAVVEH